LILLGHKLMNYLIYVFFGLAPSLIWLAYFLRKDVHPESNRKILQIFFYGGLSTIPAAVIEFILFRVTMALLTPTSSRLFYFIIEIGQTIIGVALVEEYIKYLVVKRKVLNDPELDEPIDAMLYMIIAALGFAAVENILYLTERQFSDALQISILRFAFATFLHTLSSGLLGYFLALSFYEPMKRFGLVAGGLILATLFHGFYNLSLIKINPDIKFFSTALVISILAVIVSLGFKNIKKMASTCKV